MDLSSSASSSSSSTSSSPMSRRNYEAFLSFRGIDARHTIISHLYRALRQKGVRTFQDSEELEPGDWRDELFGAIEGSRIAIIMFSENYARSRWCLNELEKIMELKELGKLKVLPIFYRVSPAEVRLQEKDNGERGCYQVAMDEMEVKHGKDSETVKRWKRALQDGGDLIGIPLDQGQDEGKVVQEVVRHVLKTLNRVPLEVAKHPVGIGRHLKAIRPLLHIDPHVNRVCIVGLLGQGGVGKTTISKAICNSIAHMFDSWCFLPNVRETASRVSNGLAHLQLTLLRDLLSEETLVVPSVDAGKQLIKERLRNKRVLVILDDVDEWTQFDALAGNLNWFGKGSRIIITTRNSHVLSSVRVRHIYHVKLLQKKEANNLFRLHAFGGMQENINIDQDLIDSFVKYAGELPLALEVLGGFLRGRRASEWKGKLKELAKSPDKTINSVLKKSFDGLEETHKEMFLDAVCFFKGWSIAEVEKILDSCDFVTSLGMAILVERCLVTVVHGKIQIHDLLGAMGQSMVRGKYLRGNGIPSRVWLYEDFVDILSEDRV
ncbi:hypothetical protein MLD38_003182 [Melastoma candidum]|uniref:Uncharacterized protein n=1 Tax=Melastoma candidum TaxID=119954 RepID=A0ACB9S1F7_9MYRT|nr:hypothetical protein MLD38_003182 [Melastoma candidum]